MLRPKHVPSSLVLVLVVVLVLVLGRGISSTRTKDGPFVAVDRPMAYSKNRMPATKTAKTAIANVHTPPMTRTRARTRTKDGQLVDVDR